MHVTRHSARTARDGRAAAQEPREDRLRAPLSDDGSDALRVSMRRIRDGASALQLSEMAVDRRQRRQDAPQRADTAAGLRAQLEQLEPKLSGILSGQSKKMVFVSAARNMLYGDVVTLMDLVRSAGAESIGLVTDDKIADAPLGETGQ